jgi:hypothetical protein
MITLDHFGDTINQGHYKTNILAGVSTFRVLVSSCHVEFRLFEILYLFFKKRRWLQKALTALSERIKERTKDEISQFAYSNRV